MSQQSRAIRILVISVILPLVITVAAVIITLVSSAHSPTSVPIHFNAGGGPNAYGSPYTYPTLLAVVCVPLVVILGGVAVLVSHRRPYTIMLKILSVSSLWVPVALSVMFTAFSVGGAAGNRAEPLYWIAIAFGGAAVVAACGWFILPPRMKTPLSDGTPTPAVALKPDERATWLRTASASTGLVLAFVGLSIFVAAAAVFAVVATGGVVWEVALVPIVLLLVTLATFTWHVRVDSRGLDVRSVLGVPRFRVLLEDVVSADARTVDAFSEFGGWGIRFGLNGRLGIILRSGDALEVKRRKGLALVITVDDAASAAALLNGLVERNG